MTIIWLYGLASVIVVSLISLVGALAFSLKEEDLNKVLMYLVSFSAGGLFGDSFIHLIPEAARESGFGMHISLYILLGIIISLVLEKFLQWRHCHASAAHVFTVVGWGALHRGDSGFGLASAATGAVEDECSGRQARIVCSNAGQKPLQPLSVHPS